MIKQATTPELAFLERFDPLERMRWLGQPFKSHSAASPNPKTITAAPTFVTKSKHFDGPRSPDSTPCRLLPRVEDLTFFPPILCCFGEANWYGKINVGH
jgi:hypothetical protein